MALQGERGSASFFLESEKGRATAALSVGQAGLPALAYVRDGNRSVLSRLFTARSAANRAVIHRFQLALGLDRQAAPCCGSSAGDWEVR